MVHEFVRYFDDNFFTLGISLVSISPKSECSNSFLILFDFFSSTTSALLFDLNATNFFISSSTTLPSLSLPETLFISTPSSLANFLAFGLADEMLDTLFKTLVSCWTSGSITSIFLNSFSIIGFCSTFWFICDDFSKVKIKSPSDTLSPTFKFNLEILPSKLDGISTLDLSLSIVIKGSFFLIDWPFLLIPQ